MHISVFFGGKTQDPLFLNPTFKLNGELTGLK